MHSNSSHFFHLGVCSGFREGVSPLLEKDLRCWVAALAKDSTADPLRPLRCRTESPKKMPLRHLPRRPKKTPPLLGSGRSTVGKCLDQNGPKWSKRPFWSKCPYSELDFSIHDGPKWSILVHFGLKRSILVHLGPPTVLWPFLTFRCASSRASPPSGPHPPPPKKSQRLRS